MSDRPTFSISTAIPYANGSPHIGHAYELIATDAIARFKRIDGFDVRFISGMDEHGQKMQQTAARLGITAQDLADRTAAEFEAMGELLEAQVDDRVRTTEPRHIAAAQAIWERMRDAGDIYLSKYPGWYSVRDEAFFDEDELIVASDGTKRAPGGAPVEWVEEESYYFKLSAYAGRLLAHYTAHPEFIVPEKYRNEIVAFVERGLNDLSISRSTFDWGIPVPGDPAHVMYVWVDALTNYLTGAGWPAEPNPRFWPMNVHVIGKDITRFHAIFWPAFLMSANLPLPKQVVVHGFLFNKGEKMSKSVGNVIDPRTLAATYGVDPLRFFFLREVPFGQDGNYSHEAIVNRTNAELSNDLGNLSQRSLSMIAKNCEGRVPEPGALTAADEALLADARALPALVRAAMDEFTLHLALGHIWRVVADANRYFAAEEPWAKKKSDPARMGTILYVTAEVVRIFAILAQPFMPSAMERMLDALGVPADKRYIASIEARGGLVPGTAIAGADPGLSALRRGAQSRRMIIDSHCHLDFPDFAPERDAIVARARAAGLARMITISTRVDRFEQVRTVADAYPDVFFTTGTHPHEAHLDPEVPAQQIAELARHPKCVGIGEAGLDYHYDRAPRDVAARVFRTHIAAARTSGLPLVIHTREADDDTAAILAEEMGQGTFKALLHCFTAGPELARTALDLGLSISFSGVLTFKKSDALRAIAAEVPLDRLLVETDAPFLAPTPHRGQRNEPAYVVHTAKVLAEIKGVSYEALAAATSANVLSLFDKMPPLRAAEAA